MAEKACFTTNFVDIFTISEVKLAVFPNFIVIGEPIFDLKYQKVKFICENSLKITEISVINWFKFLKKLYSFFNPNTESEIVIEKNKNFLIYCEESIEENENLDTKTNCIFYKVDLIAEKTKCVTITSTYFVKPVQFTFKYLNFMELYKAFSAAFFKLYGYSTIENLCIENFIKSSSTTTGLIKKGTFKDILAKVKSDTIIDLTINQCFKITELIIRHRTILVLWKECTFFNLEDDSESEI
jgi:hypothetical protein